MTARRAAIAATIVTLVSLGAIIGALYRATMPPDVWAKIDQAWGDVAHPTQVIREGEPAEIRLRVPPEGIGRIDVRLSADVDADPSSSAPPRARFSVKGARSTRDWSVDLALADIPADGYTSVELPEIRRTDATEIVFRIEAVGTKSPTALTMWTLRCHCLAMYVDPDSLSERGLRTVPDIAVHARADGRSERYALALDRISATTPRGFGASAIIAWVSIALIAGATVYWLAAFRLLKGRRPQDVPAE